MWDTTKFEMSDYDTDLKNSKYPQQMPENPSTPAEEPAQEKPQEKEVKQEPIEETTMPNDPETTTPSNNKPNLAQKRLGSGLDGNYWKCSETHGRRLRVRTTGLQEEEEYLDSWDNTIPVDGDEAAGED